MALTITIVKKPALPSGQSLVADFKFDNAYVTGGLSLKPSDLGLQDIAYLDAKQKGVASRLCEFDPVAQTLKLFTALGTEAANASDQSTITVRALVLGPNATGNAAPNV
jgi:hypothetical protein